MPEHAPKISELYLAFRQAKSSLFFEKRGVGLREIAEYEQNLYENLKSLRKKLANGAWFDQLEVGEVWIVPKRFRDPPAEGEDVIRIGSPKQDQAARSVDVQVRLSPHPDYAITEVLYLWEFGELLESLLSEDVVGYRLDVKNNEISKHRRWLFEYWPKRYQEFRSAPLAAAARILANDSDAVIISADLASFYDTVEPSFLLEKTFLRELRENGASTRATKRFKHATSSLLSSYDRFRAIASKRLTVPVHIGIPIGALTSRVLANVSLATLDRFVSSRPEVACYARYVDDLVIVIEAKGEPTALEVISDYLPIISSKSELLHLNAEILGRRGSEFQVQQRKIKVHHLHGEPGADFVKAVDSDFARALSERRAFIDSSTLVGGGVAHLIRANNGAGSPLRVLREADRARLEHFALSTSLRSLERVTSMINHAEAKKMVRECLERVVRVLDSENDWVDDLDVALRLLKLAIITGDWVSAIDLRSRLDRVWGTTEALRASAGTLYYRNQRLDPIRRSPWIWLRNYLHERRLEAICACLPIGMHADEIDSSFPGGVRVRTHKIGATTLRRRSELLALTDLRTRDREEDGSLLCAASEGRMNELRRSLRRDPELALRLSSIDEFIERCRRLGDPAWNMPAARLFLCTRPPSYFDVAHRWLYQVEDNGFDSSIFEKLIDVVNAVRGTSYGDPVGRVLDTNTIAIEGKQAAKPIDDSYHNNDPRIILGNLVVKNEWWEGAATRVSGSSAGRPSLTWPRLRGLADVLEKAERASRKNSSEMLVLPELSIPRQWFRTVSNHVVKLGRFGLVTGLEYLHSPTTNQVANQAFAVLPGPLMSVATWPWTKRMPAREEARSLSKMPIPLSFSPPAGNPPPRTVIHSNWGTFSVLICSELIEARLTADLLGRADVVLCPAWNPDTASYDHLIQSVGFQLHAIIAISNNGHYSDCRAWAPRTERWERDLCRLIERDVDDIVYVDIPIASLQAFHGGDKQATDRFGKLRKALMARKYADAKRELERLTDGLPSVWRPLPPDWEE
ncbi:hypothetical protein ABIA71_003587 [Stenotrophomonas sp. 2619]|uniref:hypothetical protein n=1 Tax=Stenotrophomonas sp. 2619 TaxID=3156316 RepID=UPI003398AEF3